jgi:hypothetical protein
MTRGSGETALLEGTVTVLSTDLGGSTLLNQRLARGAEARDSPGDWSDDPGVAPVAGLMRS